jgi:hypothetical protein
MSIGVSALLFALLCNAFAQESEPFSDVFGDLEPTSQAFETPVEPSKSEKARGAAKAVRPKKETSETWWEKNKNIMGGTLLALAATSAGLGYWQNSEATSKERELRNIFNNAEKAAMVGDINSYIRHRNAYGRAKEDLQSAQGLRNGFYIGAGVFGIAGAVTFFF